VDETRNIAFHTSPNLKQWDFQSRIEGFFECPDLVELPLVGTGSGSASNIGGATAERSAVPTKWVLYAADGRYLLGNFDGRQFHRESGPHQVWYGNFYAAQTFSNVPDGRHIQIGWARGITFPGMPFNQQMTIPIELTLRETSEGVRMFAEPVRELESLRARKHSMNDVVLDGESMLDALHGGQFDISAEFEIGGKRPPGSFGLTIRGVSISYDAEKQLLSCRDVVAPLKTIEHRARLRILVDRGSIEIFGNDGEVAISVGVHFPDDHHAVSLFSRGGPVRVRTLNAYELQSAW
jgi:fructan beta-fructosidase